MVKAECIYSKLWARQQDLKSTRPIPDSPATSNGTPVELTPARARPGRLSAKDDAKLIFGTIFSLRNMVRKLGGPDDRLVLWKLPPNGGTETDGRLCHSFISYRTGEYKLHYYETPTNIKFVMLTDTQTLNMRNVLHQIYVNLYVEFGKKSRIIRSLLIKELNVFPVVKNPLSPVEHPGGEGVGNELFELALDQFVKRVL